MSLSWLQLARPYYHLALCQEVQDVDLMKCAQRQSHRGRGEGQWVTGGSVGAQPAWGQLISLLALACHPNTCL